MSEGRAGADAPAGPGGRSEDRAGAPVAAFDFDGTLSRRDSLLPFLAFVCGADATARAVVAEGGRLGRVLLGTASRDEAKEALLTRLLSGEDAGEVRESGRLYADRLVNRGLRPAMRRRLESHRRAGHRLVLVSASPTIYLEAAGRLLGVDAVLATELEVDADGRLTGRMSGRNCRGAEKARRLRDWLETGSHDTGADSDPSQQVWAYGDSTGDIEMLALADNAVWVGWRTRFKPSSRRRR